MYRFCCRNKYLTYLTGILLLFCCACTPVLPETTATSQSKEAQPESIEPVNHPPVIELMSAPQTVALSSNNRISCEASDEDGDSLSYAWNADEGAIYGTGDTITWIAPALTGTYKISVIVSDGNGGTSEDSIYVTVSEGELNRPPSITLSVTPRGKTPIVPTSADEPATVRVWSVLEIECIAEDPDGDALDYNWSASGGTLTGEGAKVEYIARDRGDHVITVTVTDSTGRQVSGNIYLHVQCCGG